MFLHFVVALVLQMLLQHAQTLSSAVITSTRTTLLCFLSVNLLTLLGGNFFNLSFVFADFADKSHLNVTVLFDVGVGGGTCELSL